MQGFNMGRYVPPDLEGTISGNKLNNKHALGARAAKLKSQGILTVRFEMPFAVWCTTCPKPAIIGQGVRFNAEKKKVGNYYSTPIWSFRMKHAACGGWIEMKTDPKNTAYVVTEGGKARDYGDDGDRLKEGEGGLPILTEQERQRRREDAFAQLEGKVEEKTQSKDNAKRIEELYRARERDWDDPFAANKRVRTAFRRERKVGQCKDEAAKAIKDRVGLDVELLPEKEDDARRAAAVDFTATKKADDAAAQPLFKAAALSRMKAVATKPEELRAVLKDNTRASLNPFASAPTSNSVLYAKRVSRISGLSATTAIGSPVLVSYASDSD